MKQLSKELYVCMDIGCEEHYVFMGLSTGERVDEFSFSHTSTQINEFFQRIDKIEKQHKLPVSIVMEGYNGYARPIDSYALKNGYRLFNVNNLKLARFKEIFPGPAKTDPIDAKKIFELFSMKNSGLIEKGIIQEVFPISKANNKLKHFTRRRRALVQDKTRILNRIQGNLHAACPGLLSITKDAANLWFLRFITSCDDLVKLSRLKRKSLLKIKGVGKKYNEAIIKWQKEAAFSPNIAWISDEIISDAKRILELNNEITRVNQKIKLLVKESDIAERLMTIPGFGYICAGEVAGEIGSLDRFKNEASLALYLGVAVLDRQSGKCVKAKNPRHVNFRSKSAMLTAMARHIEQCPEAERYYDKKRAEGKKHNQALRSLARHIVRVIWSMLKHERDYYIIEDRNEKKPAIPAENSLKTPTKSAEVFNPPQAREKRRLLRRAAVSSKDSAGIAEENLSKKKGKKTEQPNYKEKESCSATFSDGLILTG